MIWIGLGIVFAIGLALFLWRGAAPQQGAPALAPKPTNRERVKKPSGLQVPPAPRLPALPGAELPKLPRLGGDEEEGDDDITRITLSAGIPSVAPPNMDGDETTRVKADGAAVPIIYDDDAMIDEPTRISPLILVSASGQSDTGKRRRKNEDCLLMLEEHGIYVVADGMGGHAGGEVASRLSVDMIAEAFTKTAFVGKPYSNVPKRGSELVLSIQMANSVVFERACKHPELEGMGTTIVAARFSPSKQRLYVGHVGDSRCYRLRNGQLRQMTTDHNMKSEGMAGPFAEHLSRAVGIQSGVKVDLIVARPLPKDIYLLCSDGLNKMVPDTELQELLVGAKDIQGAVDQLVLAANARGGKDNITVIVVEVRARHV